MNYWFPSFAASKCTDIEQRIIRSTETSDYKVAHGAECCAVLYSPALHDVIVQPPNDLTMSRFSQKSIKRIVNPITAEQNRNWMFILFYDFLTLCLLNAQHFSFPFTFFLTRNFIHFPLIIEIMLKRRQNERGRQISLEGIFSLHPARALLMMAISARMMREKRQQKRSHLRWLFKESFQDTLQLWTDWQSCFERTIAKWKEVFCSRIERTTADWASEIEQRRRKRTEIFLSLCCEEALTRLLLNDISRVLWDEWASENDRKLLERRSWKSASAIMT